ncbi:unnamed protein product [Caenorhabditis sp. 36 PRJEB53466]|nr:unnamed protein product [Caenorhabditis sp. 36 PRJEB53466]
MYNDDDGDDIPVAPPPPKQAKTMNNIQMAFMQTQLAQRKAALQQQAARQKLVKPSAPPPVIDLSTRNRTAVAPSVVVAKPSFQPIRANPVAENISFLPKAATDESVLIFGEEGFPVPGSTRLRSIRSVLPLIRRPAAS